VDAMDEDYAPAAPVAKRGRGRSAKVAKEEIKEEGEGHNAAVQHAQEIKTKFPTARIKRIMQADEDVGKVAQVTPILVCMCLHASDGKMMMANRLQRGLWSYS